jgi:acetyltransferase-like isoleucine patch superfamily enzyme
MSDISFFKLLFRKFIFLNKPFEFQDLWRKIVVVMNFRFGVSFIGILRSYFYFKTHRVRIGRNVCLSGVCRKVEVGEDINIYNNCTFEFGENAYFSLGSHVIFSYGVVVSVNKHLVIGDFVQFGEYSSIRDSTHDYSLSSVPMMRKMDLLGDIVIGNNVWIGKGCVILPNTRIEDNVVFGANSVISGNYPSGKLYAGARAKYIKDL